MKALTLQQPWAWAIFNAGKDIENRPKLTHIRQPIAIHAALKPYPNWKASYPSRTLLPPEGDWTFGAIIGFVDLVGCVEQSRSKWFFGPYGYVLENPRPLVEPVECTGALGFWDVSPEVLRNCRIK